MADNTIITTDLAKVQDIDFVGRFNGNIKKLVEALRVTRKIPLTAGSVIKVYKTSGQLENGVKAEGAEIPLSKYTNVLDKTYELDFRFYRKQTTLEAIAKRGYKQAVGDTDDKMLRDIQKTIRKDFFDFVKTGTGAATGTTFQAALANAWGQLSVSFEDDDASPVYFVNPLDIAEYLGNAAVTMQTAFGFSYIENFLGLGTVIVNSDIEKGKVIATASENIVMYYCPAGGADIGKAFDFYADETGYVMIHHDPTYSNATTETVAVSGIKFFPEYLDRIVVSTIADAV